MCDTYAGIFLHIKSDIALDCKSLAALAKDHPEVFTRFMEGIKAK